MLDSGPTAMISPFSITTAPLEIGSAPVAVITSPLRNTSGGESGTAVDDSRINGGVSTISWVGSNV